MTPAEQGELSSRIIESGRRYAVCAGHLSSSWDDSIDLAAVIAELDGKRVAGKHVMTTWHSEDSLDAVVDFFFTHTAFDDFLPTRCLALTLGGTGEQNDRLEGLVTEWTAD